jgi:hypothetical protein
MRPLSAFAEEDERQDESKISKKGKKGRPLKCCLFAIILDVLFITI